MKKELLKTIKKTLILLLFLAFSISYAQESFSSISFNAAIINSVTPNAEVESTMDSEGNIHIAWIRTLNDVETVMYTFFNTTTHILNTYEVDNNFQADSKIIGSINTLDNKPYIAYLIRRDSNEGTRNGNYAVMLASDSNGNNNFTVEQASTNPTDPTIEQEDLYSCWVNGRPNVFFSGNNIVVSYVADANNNTDWDRFIIYATKSGTTWSYSQEFNTRDDLGGTYNESDSIAVISDATYSYAAYIEISDYTVRYLYKSSSNDWVDIEVGDYGATFGNEHPQLVKDNDGDVHLLWYNEENSQFCHTTLNGDSYSTVQETSSINLASLNFMPATIDKTLKTPVYHYQSGFGGGIGRFIFVEEDNTSAEYTVPDDELGVPYGRKSIFANNGVMYLITASQGDGKIYITSNDGSIVNTVLSTNDYIDEEKSITLYPNPVNSHFKLNIAGNLNLYTITGRKIGNWIVKSNQEIDTNHLNSGIYYYTLTDENNVKFKGKLIKK